MVNHQVVWGRGGKGVYLRVVQLAPEYGISQMQIFVLGTIF